MTHLLASRRRSDLVQPAPLPSIGEERPPEEEEVVADPTSFPPPTHLEPLQLSEEALMSLHAAPLTPQGSRTLEPLPLQSGSASVTVPRPPTTPSGSWAYARRRMSGGGDANITPTKLNSPPAAALSQPGRVRKPRSAREEEQQRRGGAHSSDEEEGEGADGVGVVPGRSASPALGVAPYDLFDPDVDGSPAW